MRRFWREHSLTILLVLLLVAVLAVGTWATWHEFRTNETAGNEAHAPFVSQRFAVYWLMQLGTNYAAELMGLITIVLLTKKFRERFSAESD